MWYTLKKYLNQNSNNTFKVDLKPIFIIFIGMSLTSTNISKFVANIHLKKRMFFGNYDIITITVTPSFNIVSINDRYNILPFEGGEFLRINSLIEWSVTHEYEISFTTKNSKLKRDLYFYFDQVILKNKNNKKSTIRTILTWIKSLIKTKIFIKK